MPARILFFTALGLFTPAVRAAGQAPAPAPPGTATEPVPGLPASPAELFSALGKGTRPQWRTFFRETVPHSADDRFKAALALGAIDADCYLAAEARDAQQIRNLLTDMASIEMMLSISRSMSSLRRKMVELAEAGDWPGVRAEVAVLMTRHAELLAEQKDEDLAELERIGCWLRAFHVGTRFAARLPRPPERPSIWSGELLARLHGSAATLGGRNKAKSLQTLIAGLDALTKLWAGPTTPANAAERLAATTPVLDALMSDLIGDAPAAERTPPRPEP